MIKEITPENSPLYGTRAGVEIKDFHQDTVRFTDGGDGSILVQMVSLLGDVAVKPSEVEALRDYLNTVLDAMHGEG